MSAAEAKLFTPRQANQTLPLVKRIVDDILAIGEAMRARSIEVGSNAESDPQIQRHIEQLEELFQELESLGCSYKDWNFTVGLVDFPAVIDGQEVYLCWKSDEPAIAFYHDLESGFTGRQPIPEEYR